MKNQFKQNFYTSIVYNAIYIIAFFFIYKIIIKNLGEESLGLWSYTLAFGALSISFITINGSNFLYLFKEYYEESKAKFNSLFLTFFISNNILYLITVAIIVGIVKLFENKLTASVSDKELWQLLKYSFVIYYFNNMAVFLSSFLEIKLMHYVKNIINAIGVIILFILILIASQQNFTIQKVLQAQVVQYVTISILFGVLYLRLFSFSFKNIRLQWKRLFALLHKNFQLQLIGVFSNLVEPIVKFFITAGSGLATLGLFETAYRIIVLARNMLVNINQFQIAEVVHTEDFVKSVKSNFSFILQLNVLYFVFLALAGGVVSFAFFKNINPQFILIYFVILTTYAVNIQISTAYFSFVGLGKFKDLLFAHLIIVLLCIGLGYIFLYFKMNTFIILSWSVGIIVGSQWLNHRFAKKYDIPLPYKEYLKEIILAVLFVIISLLVTLSGFDAYKIIGVLVFLGIIYIFIPINFRLIKNLIKSLHIS